LFKRLPVFASVITGDSGFTRSSSNAVGEVVAPVVVIVFPAASEATMETKVRVPFAQAAGIVSAVVVNEPFALMVPVNAFVNAVGVVLSLKFTVTVRPVIEPNATAGSTIAPDAPLKVTLFASVELILPVQLAERVPENAGATVSLLMLLVADPALPATSVVFAVTVMAPSAPTAVLSVAVNVQLQLKVPEPFAVGDDTTGVELLFAPPTVNCSERFGSELVPEITRVANSVPFTTLSEVTSAIVTVGGLTSF